MFFKKLRYDFGDLGWEDDGHSHVGLQAIDLVFDDNQEGDNL